MKAVCAVTQCKVMTWTRTGGIVGGSCGCGMANAMVSDRKSRTWFKIATTKHKNSNMRGSSTTPERLSDCSATG